MKAGHEQSRGLRFLSMRGSTFLFTLTLLSSTGMALAVTSDSNADHKSFDARVAFNQGLVQSLSAPQQAVIADMARKVPDLSFAVDAASGAISSLSSQTGYLSEPRKGQDALPVIRDFLSANAPMMGMSAQDLSSLEVTDRVYSKITGTTHVFMRQVHQGLPVYNSQMQVNLDKEQRILSVNNSAMTGMAASVKAIKPALDLSSAVGKAAQHLGMSLPAAPKTLNAAAGVQQVTSVDPAGISLEAIQGKLMWLPIHKGLMQLVWNFQIHTLDQQHVYDFTVDAETGKVWTRFDWVASDQYRVYARPAESPSHITPLPPSDGRTLVDNPANTTASPFGWHDTNGSGGAEFTTPRGNNAYAYTDTDANNAPDTGPGPNGGSSLRFDFPISLNSAPGTYQNAAVTNLFYWNNIIHDVQYQYGFDEAAGNFQANNYGKGGREGDAVLAEAQDGSGSNNANFMTPPDGTPPRMQMYLWNRTAPERDGDLDNGIIIHEYGHGISTRLVGGPSNVNCLTNNQQPGEGLSDWWSLVYTAKTGDKGPDPRGIGTYAFGQPVTGEGIREQPYSTDPAVNTWTYASISGMRIPHGVGSVWAQAAWEVYWALVDHWGFDPNLYNATGSAGNQRMMLYVNEGLKNTACNPTFTQVRDGIIDAAKVLHGGEDVCRIWTAFAAFGLGTDAVSGGPDSTSPTNGFSVPAACQANNDPSAAITAPTNGAVVSGSITVSATATDNAGIDKIEFYVDDVLKGTANRSPYNITLNTTTLTNGIHILAVKAYNTAGNVGTSPNVIFTISNTSPSPTSYNEVEDNGSLRTANAVADTVTGIVAYIGTSTDQDYFKVNVAAGRTLKVSMTGPARDYDLYLLRSSGNVLRTSDNVGSTESVTYRNTSASAVLFYIKVAGFGGGFTRQTPYKLVLSR